MKNLIRILLIAVMLSGCNQNTFQEKPIQCSQLPISICQNGVSLYLYSCTMSNDSTQYGDHYAQPSYRVATTNTCDEVIRYRNVENKT